MSSITQEVEMTIICLNVIIIYFKNFKIKEETNNSKPRQQQWWIKVHIVPFDKSVPIQLWASLAQHYIASFCCSSLSSIHARFEESLSHYNSFSLVGLDHCIHVIIFLSSLQLVWL
jgi:hypothetical protein